VGEALNLLDLGPPSRERAGVGLGGTELSAVGTGLLVGEFLGLLLEEEFQGPFGEALGGGSSDLFHGSEIDVESGSVFAEGAFGNNFAPLGGKLSKF
jgi:hypothetical protein